MLNRRSILQKLPIIVMGMFLLGFIITSPLHAQSIEQVPLQVPIGNIKSIVVCETGTNGELICNGIARYLSAIYLWVIRASAIAAVVVIMVAGMRWLTARGDAGAVKSAKKMLSNAIIGLVLVIGSYSLLYLINPDLVEFRSLNLRSVPEMSLEVNPIPMGDASGNEAEIETMTPEQKKEATESRPVTPEDLGLNESSTRHFQFLNEVEAVEISRGILYKQCDQKWKSSPIMNSCSKTLCYAGCGPSSVAMILYHLGKDATPKTVANHVVQNNLYSCSGGTDVIQYSKQKSFQDKYGVKVEHIYDYNTALQRLRSHQWLITSIKDVPADANGIISPGLPIRFKGGHYVVVASYNDALNTAYILDPSEYNLKKMTKEQLSKYQYYSGKAWFLAISSR